MAGPIADNRRAMENRAAFEDIRNLIDASTPGAGKRVAMRDRGTASNANPIAASVSHKTTAISEEQASESTMTYSSPTEEMIVWMRRGFAFTLPLIGTMLLGLLLAKLMF